MFVSHPPHRMSAKQWRSHNTTSSKTYTGLWCWAWVVEPTSRPVAPAVEKVLTDVRLHTRTLFLVGTLGLSRVHISTAAAIALSHQVVTAHLSVTDHQRALHTGQSQTIKKHGTPVSHRSPKSTAHLSVTDHQTPRHTCQSQTTKKHGTPVSHRPPNTTTHLSVTDHQRAWHTCQSQTTKHHGTPVNHRPPKSTAHLSVTDH